MPPKGIWQYLQTFLVVIMEKGVAVGMQRVETRDAAKYPPRHRDPSHERLILVKDERYFCLSTKVVLNCAIHLVPAALKYMILYVFKNGSFHYFNYLHKLRFYY